MVKKALLEANPCLLLITLINIQFSFYFCKLFFSFILLIILIDKRNFIEFVGICS